MGSRVRLAWTAGGLLALALILNLWENRWGTPAEWHPDEIVRTAAWMAETRDVNPHFFAYGGLHYYVLIGAAWIPVKLYERAFDPMPAWRTAEHERWRERHVTRLLIAGRTVSAVLAALLVLITLVMGRLLFGGAAGELGALFLCLSPGLVVIAHFATVDAAANFWYWLSCLGALLIWRRDGRARYVLAGAAVGFAAGTKVDRLIAVVPLLTAHLLTGDSARRSDLLLAALSLPLAFVLANSALVVAPFEFLDGFTRDLFFNANRERLGPPFRILRAALWEGLGPALFVAMLPGLYGVALRIRRVGQRKEVVWLTAAILPYALLIGMAYAPPWYAVLLFPGLALLASVGWLTLIEAAPSRLRPPLRTLIGGVIVISLIGCIALNLQFARDARYDATRWIDANVAPGARIAVFARPPLLDERKFRVFRSLSGEGTWRAGDVVTRDRVERSRTYRWVTQGIRDFESWAGGRLGWPTRSRAYRAWFDGRSEEIRGSEEGGGDLVQADVVVLSDRKPTLEWLRAPDSGFRLAREFRAPDLLGLAPSFNFVDPPVYIFQRREVP